MAALAHELGLTLVPMDDCKLLGNDGKSVPEAMDQRIQRLWNRVLDECAEKQRTKKNHGGSLPLASRGVGSSGDDSRGETSEESHGEGSSSAESEVAEREDVNGQHSPVRRSVHSTYVETPTPTEAQDVRELTETGSKERASGPEDEAVIGRPAQCPSSTAPVSLGTVLEETAREHLANFSKAEMEVWNWHRGNLEISCGAVSVSRGCLLVDNASVSTRRR